MEGLYDGPLFHFENESYEITETDLEAERGQIRDEIAEALGAVEADTSDTDSEADADSDSDASSEGF